MKFYFIVRPPAKKDYQEEVLAFKKEFKAKEEFTEVKGEKNAQNLAKKAIEEGFQRIIVVGGDGSLNEVANGVMAAMNGNFPSEFALGIIPAGAGNNFAKELGIKNIKEAFSIIKQNKIDLVDIGKVNDRYFINCFSVGFDALVNKIANDIKTKYQFLPRNLSYLLAALGKIIVGIPNFQIQIKGETDYQNKVILAAVTNSPSYGGIFKINPDAIINDGKLNLCIIETVGRIRAFFDLYRVSRGSHTNLPEMKMLKFSFPLTISSPELLPYEVDGEVPEPEREYKVNVFPRILPILVP
jgi:YegS/Rv2252/BmrU family lipid kinase